MVSTPAHIGSSASVAAVTDEQADRIAAALEALTAEVRGLRADLAPKSSVPINTAPWMPSWPTRGAGWTCSQCHAFVSMGAPHSCPGIHWNSATAGTNQA